MQFKSDADNTNLKPINAMHQGLIYPLDSTALDSLNMIAATITPDNNIEVNYKEVFELALKNPTMKDSVYLPADIKRLRIIANLCPFTDGNAVYTARVILHAFEPDSNYYNYCEFAKMPDRTSNERNSFENKNKIKGNVLDVNYEYKVIPNPNNGSFELLTSSNNSITCEISDMAGRIIEIGNYKPIGNKVPFSYNNLNKGVYHLKIIDNTKVTTIKIVIN